MKSQEDVYLEQDQKFESLIPWERYVLEKNAICNINKFTKWQVIHIIELSDNKVRFVDWRADDNQHGFKTFTYSVGVFKHCIVTALNTTHDYDEREVA